MPTVTFRCGSCSQLIGVEADQLQQHVRCTHCQGMVLAQWPPTAVTAPETIAPAERHLTAIASPEPPSASPPSNQPAEESVPAFLQIKGAEQATSTESIATTADSTRDWDTSLGLPDPFSKASLQSLFDSPATSAAPEREALPELAAKQPHRDPHQTDALPPAVVMSTRRQMARPTPSVSIWYVIPLVSYAILSTLLIVALWTRLQTVEEHPLAAFLPDSEGDAPGVVRKPKGVNEARKRKLIADPLPDSLKMHPGETRTVGALAVTPLRISRRRIAVGDGEGRPEKLKGPSLVLHLRLENISDDESFQPLDRYFDRKWREGSSPGPPPLTLLEAGPGRRIFGGPAEWHPRPASRRNDSAPPEFIYLVDGNKAVIDPVDRALGPGEATEVFVCTDGNDPRSVEMTRLKGNFLWRVHVRRGLVRIHGRDMPAAAVVGVVFSDRDIGDG
jgi:DNA-directed RNA polymerase subunit RPC12/RpoP